MMRGSDLLEKLDSIGARRKEVGSVAGGSDGCLFYDVCDIVVARGHSDQDLHLVPENITDVIEMMEMAPDLRDLYDEESFRTLSELLTEV